MTERNDSEGPAPAFVVMAPSGAKIKYYGDEEADEPAVYIGTSYGMGLYLDTEEFDFLAPWDGFAGYRGK